MNSQNYQLDLNIPSDNSSNLRNLSQILSNEDVLKMIKQKNAEKRLERETNQQNINEKQQFKVPQQQSKQLLSLQKQEISFNDRYAQYLSPMKNEKHLVVDPQMEKGNTLDQQKDYQSMKSNQKNNNTVNQDNSMDKFLLED